MKHLDSNVVFKLLYVDKTKVNSYITDKKYLKAYNTIHSIYCLGNISDIYKIHSTSSLLRQSKATNI